MSSFRVLQLKRRHFGPLWYKTTSFWMLKQFFFLTAMQYKMTLFWTVAVQNDVVLKLF